MVITEALIECGKSINGGWSTEQMAILGVDWPPAKRWKERVVGNTITDEDASKFVALKDAHMMAHKREPARERVRAECRSCGAPIFWGRTAATQSLMPLDWLASANGNMVIDDNGNAAYIKRDLFDPDKSVI